MRQTYPIASMWCHKGPTLTLYARANRARAVQPTVTIDVEAAIDFLRESNPGKA